MKKSKPIRRLTTKREGSAFDLRSLDEVSSPTSLRRWLALLAEYCGEAEAASVRNGETLEFHTSGGYDGIDSFGVTFIREETDEAYAARLKVLEDAAVAAEAKEAVAAIMKKNKRLKEIEAERAQLLKDLGVKS
jgi:hypothetical protein